jgi:hypothetical protein
MVRITAGNKIRQRDLREMPFSFKAAVLLLVAVEDLSVTVLPRFLCLPRK